MSFDLFLSSMELNWGRSTWSISIVAGIICALIAASKNRSPVGWFFIGGLLSCFGIILVLCMSDLEKPTYDAEIAPERPRRPPPPPAKRVVEPTAPPAEEPYVWYWVDHGQAAGPVPRSVLIALARAGTVTADVLVWREGFREWQPMSSVRELA